MFYGLPVHAGGQATQDKCVPSIPIHVIMNGGWIGDKSHCDDDDDDDDDGDADDGVGVGVGVDDDNNECIGGGGGSSSAGAGNKASKY